MGSLELARSWSDYYGRPIHIGEFGCYVEADPESRARFYLDMRSAMDELGIGWAMWDWSAGFRYWNETANEPAPGMREAMFPKLSLLPLGPGSVRSKAAVGKTLQVQRRTALRMDTPWLPLHSTNLTAPLFDFSDPNPPEVQAFYQLEWIR